MIKIYHNNRCRKSREGLEIIENSGKEFEIVSYLDNPPTIEELNQLIKLLGITPIELVRTNESIWKEKYKNVKLSDDEIIELMAINPKLIERPIVVNDGKAVVGRPPEKIKSIL
ncbi:arsenate reductase (glutaredoxin) [Imtechella halotolerans]|uniref:Arsenate reductase n=1 Tax=Imtechella halotolerans K1 TaxID=946077 RepID=I0W8H3_9FLAO|nr:arsenate reductase (glutaredoxin) [Imtechella halotolerans]EID72689.1 arsenate reductase [Imtechella halotolerans K1]WMQ64611.1 arsenate reductase (glutaredoxin) [Imtechella halotolerans]